MLCLINKIDYHELDTVLFILDISEIIFSVKTIIKYNQVEMHEQQLQFY